MLNSRGPLPIAGANSRKSEASAVNKFHCSLRRLYDEDSGQDMIEYVLIAALIALAAIAAISNFSTDIANYYNTNVTQKFQNAL